MLPSLGRGVSVQGDTAEMPQAGIPGVGGGQLVPALFKGQQFSTAGEGRVGGQRGPLLPNTHHPGEGGGPIRDSATPPPQPSTGSAGGVFVSLEKRGCLPFPEEPSWSSPAGQRPLRAPRWTSLFANTQ